MLLAFNLILAGQTAEALTTIIGFAPDTDGKDPRGALIEGSDGNFFGTTDAGGSSGCGTVFKMTPAGKLTTLHSFTGTKADGSHPAGALVQGSDGNFYGTTGDEDRRGKGRVFKITPAGVLTALHRFTGRGTDGPYPCADLVQGSDGNLYGATGDGGSKGCGTIFEITRAGVFTTLHSFAGEGTDGANPGDDLVRRSDGNIYGTTVGAALGGSGKVFKMTPAGVLSELHTFHDKAPLNLGPRSGLIQGRDGNFYGATGSVGGSAGTVFRITPKGAFRVLHTFASIGANEFSPVSGLTQASDGNFYGATLWGGRDGGTIFRITPSGAFRTLHSFHGKEGRGPEARPIQGRDGNFYGTTLGGGSGNAGTVYKLSPSGLLTTLHQFTGADVVFSRN